MKLKHIRWIVIAVLAVSVLVLAYFHPHFSKNISDVPENEVQVAKEQGKEAAGSATQKDTKTDDGTDPGSSSGKTDDVTEKVDGATDISGTEETDDASNQSEADQSQKADKSEKKNKSDKSDKKDKSEKSAMPVGTAKPEKTAKPLSTAKPEKHTKDKTDKNQSAKNNQSTINNSKTDKSNTDKSKSNTSKTDTSKNTTKSDTPKQEKTCTISIDCSEIIKHMDTLEENKREIVPADGVILAPVQCEISDGDSVFDVLKKVTKENNILMEYSITPLYNTAYIEGIANLYEFDCGVMSGWLYTVNGKTPGVGCSSYKVNEGDVIEFIYTTGDLYIP